jgi:16S rRNA (uracil1498-N3)-methyltransferase
LIGPEGGFTDEERAAIRALPQAKPVALGPRILRADTAAVAAISLWMATAGDWIRPPRSRDEAHSK